MMEYTILKDTDRAGLMRQVNEYIRQGWRPLGGIAVAVADPPAIYQAMVRGQ